MFSPASGDHLCVRPSVEVLREERELSFGRQVPRQARRKAQVSYEKTVKVSSRKTVKVSSRRIVVKIGSRDFYIADYGSLIHCIL